MFGLLQKRDCNGRSNLLIADWMEGDGFGGIRKRMNGISAFRNKKGIFAKIGYLIIFISFALWILWHGVMIYKVNKEPVKIVVQPLGWDKSISDKKMQVVSYVKLKNISFYSTEIQVRLYLKDTMGELRESGIQNIELWERKGEEKGTRITEDLHVIIPPKEETGLYIQAIYENSEGIYFPYHTEQEVEIIYTN